MNKQDLKYTLNVIYSKISNLSLLKWVGILSADNDCHHPIEFNAK